MDKDQKKIIEISFPEDSLEKIKSKIESAGADNLISFKIGSDVDNKENIKIMDFFRELYYKKYSLRLKAPNTKFLRNLYEGYVPKIDGDWIVVVV